MAEYGGMRVVAIGVGGAGGRIVDALHEDDSTREASYLAGGSVLETDRGALAALDAVSEEDRHHFGHSGFGGDADSPRERIEALAEDDHVEMRRAVDSAITSDAAAIIVIAGVGGATGSVIAPKLTDALQRIYDRPVYAVSVLPATHEEVPPENPARAIAAFESAANAQLVFDNDAWVDDRNDVEDVTDGLNAELAMRLGALFSAGEAVTAESVGQRVVDASEVISTLDEGGLATIGFARQPLGTDGDDGSLLDRARELVGMDETTVDEVESIKAVETTLRQATNGRLTFDCPRDAARSGLLVVSGPPEWLHQTAVSDGQSWLADEIGSVQLRTGDNPMPGGDELTILVLLGGIRGAPRIKEIQAATD